MEAGAFGAGKAGTSFNPVEFVQRPQVILRLLNIVSTLVVEVSYPNAAMFPNTATPPYCLSSSVY